MDVQDYCEMDVSGKGAGRAPQIPGLTGPLEKLGFEYSHSSEARCFTPPSDMNIDHYRGDFEGPDGRVNLRLNIDLWTESAERATFNILRHGAAVGDPELRKYGFHIPREKAIPLIEIPPRVQKYLEERDLKLVQEESGE